MPENGVESNVYVERVCRAECAVVMRPLRERLAALSEPGFATDSGIEADALGRRLHALALQLPRVWRAEKRLGQRRINHRITAFLGNWEARWQRCELEAEQLGLPKPSEATAHDAQAAREADHIQSPAEQQTSATDDLFTYM